MACNGLCCAEFWLREPELSEHADMLVPVAPGLFTCKHWDGATRLCTIYERRPQMCRDYPEPGKVCRFCGDGELDA